MKNEKARVWGRECGMLFFLNLALAFPTFAQQAAPQEASAPAATQTEKKQVEPTVTLGAASATPADYVIGEQDVLVINVWKEPELSGAVIVRPDGKITLPLVNEIRVVGMTPIELQNTLNEKLKPFLNTPQVTISVREINSRKVYVIGQVGKEGSYHINSSTTVLQIIAEAGGLKDFANRKKIYVLRTENGKQTRYPFNYDDVVRGKSPKQDIVLRPGDTIVIP